MVEFFIALRYLFSKKSTNAINLITGISVLGISVGTAALILELAVFNGFESLLSDLFNQFNPELKITSTEGKFFEIDSSQLSDIKQLDNIESVALALEETAMFDFDGNIAFATIKGVDEAYQSATQIDSTIIAGTFDVLAHNNTGAVLGLSIKNKLGISSNNPFTQLRIYMPKKKSSYLDQPFKTAHLTPTGIFSFQQDFDNQYVFASKTFVENLIGKPGQSTSIEINLKDIEKLEKTRKELYSLLPKSVRIQDRYEQDEAFFKLMNIEKWLFYALFLLTLILVTFNIVGALWMIVLDKKKDIGLLKAMGARDGTIHKIFLLEGLLISLLGIGLGTALAIGLYGYHLSYGLISIPQGFIIDRYPMELRSIDFVIASITMLLIGMIASVLPARRARELPIAINDD